MKLEKELIATLTYAKEKDSKIITTVEAFHKDPKLLYDYLRLAANNGLTVHFAPIKTTDQEGIRIL